MERRWWDGGGAKLTLRGIAGLWLGRDEQAFEHVVGT